MQPFAVRRENYAFCTQNSAESYRVRQPAERLCKLRPVKLLVCFRAPACKHLVGVVMPVVVVTVSVLLFSVVVVVMTAAVIMLVLLFSAVVVVVAAAVSVTMFFFKLLKLVFKRMRMLHSA